MKTAPGAWRNGAHRAKGQGRLKARANSWQIYVCVKGVGGGERKKGR